MIDMALMLLVLGVIAVALAVDLYGSDVGGRA